MFLRVISDLKRWSNDVCGNEQLIPADCFSDIKTTNNTLSLWQVDETNDSEIINYAVISTLNRMRFQKISYILVSDEELTNNGLTICQTDSVPDYLNSTSSNFINHHYDIINIDYQCYGKIATLFRNKIKNNQQDIILDKSAIEAAKQLYQNGIINIKPLQDKIRKTILDNFSQQ